MTANGQNVTENRIAFGLFGNTLNRGPLPYCIMVTEELITTIIHMHDAYKNAVIHNEFLLSESIRYTIL